MTAGLEIDFETRSDRDIRVVGAYLYFASPHTKALMASYKINGGPKKRWRYTEPCPPDIAAHINAGGTISAHNASFERLLFDMMADRHGWPRPRLKQFRCTAAIAAGMSLPRDLGGLGDALGLKTKKQKEGTALINFFSKPRRPKKDEPPGLYFHEPEDYPEKFEEFHAYCDDDVESESQADARMVPLSEYEQDLYWIDQLINDRGIRIDVKSARAALRIAERAKVILDREMSGITNGAVTACSQVSKLVEWINAQGVPIPSAAKAEIEELLEADDLPAHVRRALELRQEAAKNSVSKLTAFLARCGNDERLRGAFLFLAAGTGRWSSVGAQLHNLPRPRKVYGDAHVDLKTLFENFRHGDPEWLRFSYGDELGKPLHLISDALRSFIWAAPGHELCVADYSGIEGAVAAWFAGEDWKVKAMFELIANPDLPDLYRRAAAGIFNTTTDLLTKKDPRRQVGKVAELSCFAADTRILTDNGVKYIKAVLPSDKVWDGVEWVSHSGVVESGVKPVVVVDGIGVTAQHLFLATHVWSPAWQLASSAKTLSRALATGSANLPSQVLISAPPAGFATWLRRAHAALRSKRRLPISRSERLRAAERAATKWAAIAAKNISAMTTSWQTPSTATGCSAESPPRSTAAQTRTTAATRIMVGAASRFFGAKTDARFWRISSRYRVGINLIWNSIAGKLMAITRPATFNSSREPSTLATDERRKSCKPESLRSNAKSSTCVPVYDIVNAGPRNRFTVCSDSGFLIAHNCQYQGGVGAFRSMARNYSLKLDGVFPSVWESTNEDRRAAAEKRYEQCVNRGDPQTKVLSKKAWLAAELVKIGWRATHPAIVSCWPALQDGIRQAIENPGAQVTVRSVTYKVAMGFLWCRLPSGRCLAYGKPRLSEQVWVREQLQDGSWADESVVMGRAEAEKRATSPDYGPGCFLGTKVKIEGPAKPTATALGVDSVTKQFVRFALYGGLAFENIVQAIARDLLANGIKLAEAHNYPVIGHVHDEIITELPRGTADVRFFEELICRLPDWAKGLPLTASGFIAKRYKKD